MTFISNQELVKYGQKAMTITKNVEICAEILTKFKVPEIIKCLSDDKIDVDEFEL